MTPPTLITDFCKRLQGLDLHAALARFAGKPLTRTTGKGRARVTESYAVAIYKTDYQVGLGCTAADGRVYACLPTMDDPLVWRIYEPQPTPEA